MSKQVLDNILKCYMKVGFFLKSTRDESVWGMQTFLKNFPFTKEKFLLFDGFSLLEDQIARQLTGFSKSLSYVGSSCVGLGLLFLLRYYLPICLLCYLYNHFDMMKNGGPLKSTAKVMFQTRTPKGILTGPALPLGSFNK